MPYNLYSSEVVFANSNANAMCNAIMQALINEFDAPSVASGFLLTGSAAKIIQGETNKDIPVIAFVTNDLEMFDFLKLQINTIIDIRGPIVTPDRIKIVSPTLSIFIEIWHREGVLNSIDFNGVITENINDIPNYIL